MAASDLLGSPEFRNLITESVREGVQDGNIASASLLKKQDIIQKSEKFKRWSETLPDRDRSNLLSLGLLYFLVPEQATESEQ